MSTPLPIPHCFVLRSSLELNGPKYGCGLGECGACAVLIGSVAARSCVVPIEGCVGRDIVTLEGLGTRERPMRCKLLSLPSRRRSAAVASTA